MDQMFLFGMPSFYMNLDHNFKRYIPELDYTCKHDTTL